jgi:hypothetical protein
VLLRAHSDDFDAAARMLASLGWPFTVRKPAELRASLRQVADVVPAAATRTRKVPRRSPTRRVAFVETVFDAHHDALVGEEESRRS